MGERFNPVMLPAYRYDPTCSTCSGTGVGLTYVADGDMMRVVCTTPCECKRPAGVDRVDASNLTIIR